MITTTTDVSHINISTIGYSSSDRITRYSTIYKNANVLEDLTRAVCVEGNTIDTKAVTVTSDSDIALFCFSYHANSAGAFLALPRPALGCTYYAVAWHGDTSQFVIIAVENDTLVQVQLPITMTGLITWNGKNYSSSDQISGILNYHETWQLQSEDDISGTLIRANKTVAVLSGNIKANVEAEGGKSSDHLVEMLVPVDKWGIRFIAVSTPNRLLTDQIKIVTSENETFIEVHGAHPTNFTTTAAGNVTTLILNINSAIYVKATKPIMITQFGASRRSDEDNTDATMMFVVPLGQYQNNYSIAIISDDKFGSYLIIVCSGDELSGLRINGTNRTLLKQRKINVNSSMYVTGYLEMQPGTYFLKHVNTHVMFWAWLYGKGPKPEAYSMPAGMNLAVINTVSHVSTS